MADGIVRKLEILGKSRTAANPRSSRSSTGDIQVISLTAHDKADQVQIEMLRQASIPHRIALTCSLSCTVIELARRAIRRQMPGANEEESLLRFVSLHYGQQLADGLALDLERRRR